VGDWVVGLSPKAKGNRVVYAMKIDEILFFDDYYQDERFASKIPDFETGEIVCKCGDNIYEPLSNGDFRQLRSMHSKNKGQRKTPKQRSATWAGNTSSFHGIFITSDQEVRYSRTT
jgi:hypothetical protein